LRAVADRVRIPRNPERRLGPGLRRGDVRG
jgi:hypothetical protein